MTDCALTFASQAEWESWLGQNGGTSTGVWLRLAKKGVEQRTVTYEQAVESALCHGWIDGQKKAESEQYWLQRFSPRSAKSIWSKINKDKAEALIAAGRMQPSGLSEIDRARKDGRWEAAYTSASNSTVPDDLQAALDANPKAAKFFATLNSRNRYAILFRIQSAKKPETRARKIAEFIDMLKRGETFHS
ncbi:YdeI/OmpD-associated family protein [Burkholderia cenocepacia]|uniref:YdeI/OmpD-associated family protein n=1 Tax=Burkholderia cenocepacia TaxID=95486 RepID=UPI0009B23A1F|nr:YdeI/OmpD-associated family protein [Burkholderia cenocepacia]MCW3690994.1 YdeI/OmpD-associated family protein [Burkholderia cenocepacia]